MKLRILISAAALTVFGAAHAGEAWTVAADTSSVSFNFNQQGSKYTGKFEEFSATIDFDSAMAEDGSISGTVVMESVNSRDYDRDATLTDVEWFDTANYAESSFQSESVEAVGDGTYIAHGNLTLKGKTRPIDLTFTFDESGDTATFNGTMDINRFDFNVGEGWNDTSWVGQDVEVEIALDLSR